MDNKYLKNYEEFISMTMAGIIKCIDNEEILNIDGKQYRIVFEKDGFYMINEAETEEDMRTLIPLSPHGLLFVLF